MPAVDEIETAREYYEYLYAWYINDISLNRATEVLVSSPIKIFAWAIALIIFFGLFAYMARAAHRKHGELYEPMSFAGSIIERNGRVTAFTWLGILSLFISILYLGIRYIILGYLY